MNIGYMFFVICLLSIIAACSGEPNGYAGYIPAVIDYEADVTTSPPTTIASAQAQEMILYGNILILDVRTQEEFDQERIEHAVLLPHYRVYAEATRLLPDKDQTILVYCRSGVRSLYAADILVHLGYTAVYNLAGGIQAWRGPIMLRGWWPQYNYFGVLPDALSVPFVYTTAQAICLGMGEFIFTITGNHETTFHRTRTLVENEVRVVSESFYKVTSIVINRTDGSLVQEITDIATAHPSATPQNMYGLSFVEWNASGYKGLWLLRYQGGSLRNMPSYFWIWNATGELFVLSETLTNASWGGSPYFDPENNRVSFFWRNGIQNHGWFIYEYKNGQFAGVRSTEWLFIIDEENPNVIGISTETCWITGERTETYIFED